MATTGLFPVLKQVPPSERGPEGRTPPKTQSAWARAALTESLRLSGLKMPEPWEFGAQGAPRPANHVIWSLTHKPAWVGAVCAPEGLSPQGIGIDVEQVKERRNPRIFDYVADETEWVMAGEKSPESFFRLWTAKEAALKALGTGLRELGDCRLASYGARSGDGSTLTLHCRGMDWEVLQLYFEGHIASLTSFGAKVEWVLSR